MGSSRGAYTVAFPAPSCQEIRASCGSGQMSPSPYPVPCSIAPYRMQPIAPVKTVRSPLLLHFWARTTDRGRPRARTRPCDHGNDSGSTWAWWHVGIVPSEECARHLNPASRCRRATFRLLSLARMPGTYWDAFRAPPMCLSDKTKFCASRTAGEGQRCGVRRDGVQD